METKALLETVSVRKEMEYSQLRPFILKTIKWGEYMEWDIKIKKLCKDGRYCNMLLQAEGNNPLE